MDNHTLIDGFQNNEFINQKNNEYNEKKREKAKELGGDDENACRFYFSQLMRFDKIKYKYKKSK